MCGFGDTPALVTSSLVIYQLWGHREILLHVSVLAVFKRKIGLGH